MLKSVLKIELRSERLVMHGSSGKLVESSWMGENGQQRDWSSGGVPGGQKLDVGGALEMEFIGLGDYCR